MGELNINESMFDNVEYTYCRIDLHLEICFMFCFVVVIF